MVEDNIADARARRREIPGASEAEERLLAMVTALTGELAVTRERLDTLERLVEKAGVLTQQDMEDFSPDEVESRHRYDLRRRIISRVFRPLRDAAQRDLLKARRG